jgi:RimJ/RimL family protein N-acetyltransferase
MTTTSTVRRLDRDDAPAWAVLRHAALLERPLAFGASVPDAPQVLVEFGRSRLAETADSAVFGAFVDRSLIGMVGIRRDAGEKERHKSFIWGMYVTTTQRGRGVGGKLLAAAIHHARTELGVEQIHLAVSDVAPDAYKLYERNGFRAWGRAPRALHCAGSYADEIHMLLDLRSGANDR